MPQRFSKVIFFGAALMLGTVALSTDALAGGHGKGKGRHEHYRHSETQRRSGGDTIIISNRDRVVIRNYIADDYRAHCPPGLAKKRNGCLPPGQAKKYRVGQTLPAGIYVPVTGQLLTMLQPVPVGYQYVQVDRDVLLVSEASHKIIDAVTLLSAVGN